MLDDVPPILEGNLGKNPGPIRFFTAGDILRWAEDELKAWSLITDNAGLVENPWRRRLQQLKQIPQAIVSDAEALASESKASERFGQLLESIQARLAQYASGAQLHSRSPLGRRILRLAATDPRRGATLLAVHIISTESKKSAREVFSLVDDGLHRNHFEQALDAWLDYKLFERKIIGKDDPRISALDDLISRFHDAENEFRGHFESAKRERLDAIEGWTHARKEQAGQIDQLIAEKHAAFDSFYEGRKKELAELEDVYKTKLSVSAPVGYWAGKRRRHYIAAGVCGGLFVLGAAVVFLVAALYRHEILAALARHQVATWSYPEVLALVAAPILLYGWLLRMCYRQFSTNLALASDASERATMVLTFLALMVDQKAKIEEKDRILILHALFRPSPTNPTDDAGPPNWFDLLMQRIEKRA